MKESLDRIHVGLVSDIGIQMLALASQRHEITFNRFMIGPHPNDLDTHPAEGAIMKEDKVTLTGDKLKKYFPKSYTGSRWKPPSSNCWGAGPRSASRSRNDSFVIGGSLSFLREGTIFAFLPL